MANTKQKYTNPKRMQRRIDKYFEKCDKGNAVATIPELSKALNIKTRTLYAYEKREGFSQIVKAAKERCKQTARRPRKFTEPEVMQEKITAYFHKCESNKQTVVTKAGELVEIDAPLPKTVQGIAIALGIHTDTLLDYEKTRPEFTKIIRLAKLECAQDSLVGAMTGRYRDAPAIFNLKANYGWIETSKVDHTGIPPNQVLIIAPSEHSAVEEYGVLKDGESDEVEAPYVNIKQLNTPVNGRNGKTRGI